MNTVYSLRCVLIALILLSTMPLGAKDYPELMEDEDCTTIKLDQAPHPLSRVPHGSQGGTAICGAYASATLIDTYRVSKNPHLTTFTSPTYIGVLTNLFKNAVFENTNPIGILKDTYWSGACEYSIVPDSMHQDTRGLVKAYKEKNHTQMLSWLRAGGMPEAAVQRVAERSLPFNVGLTEFVQIVLKTACGPELFSLRDLPKTRVVTAYGQTSRTVALQNLRQTVNDTLARGIPLGVNYCGFALSRPTINGVNERGLFSTECGTSGSSILAGHSSVIVGRELKHYISKRGTAQTICQFRVRNTYGKRCVNMAQHLPADASGAVECKDGTYMIDEDALISNTMEVFYLDYTPAKL